MARTSMNRAGLISSTPQGGPGSRAAMGPEAVWGYHRVVVAILLVLLVVTAFYPCLGNDFVMWDDAENLLDNPYFRGLGWSQLSWAWTSFRLGVYQPVAWMILEAEYVVFGLRPWGYHLTSLVLYAINTVMLFALTVSLLGRCRPEVEGEGPWVRALGAGLAVALFAVHPLRTEVVAWASCQPYLPCAFFLMLAVLAYLHAYPDAAEPRRQWLAATFGLFVAALLSKAVAVTLPAVLLILDVYPLKRLGGGPGRWLGSSVRRVWWEKVPFAVLSLVFTGLAIAGRVRDQHLVSYKHSGIAARLSQACYATWFYLVKTVLPTNLTAYYPVPDRVVWYEPPFILCILGTIGVSVALVLLRRRWPGVLAAWASYLVILAPNMGLIQLGFQIATDRYSYISMIGGVVLAAAGVLRLSRVRPGGSTTVTRVGFTLASLAGLVALICLTQSQCLTWRSSEALWTHALSHGASQNATPHHNLGMALAAQRRLDEARAQFEHALKLSPELAFAHNNLGLILTEQGHPDEAVAQFREALRLRPGYAVAHRNLGSTLGRQGRFNEALAEFAEALKLRPDDADSHNRTGSALSQLGRFSEAESQFTDALRIQPDHIDARYNLGSVLLQEGRVGEAVAQFSEVLRSRPDHADARRKLASAFALLGRHEEAMAQFAALVRIHPDDADARNNLGTALLQQGRLDEAVAEYTRALRLQPGNPDAHNNLGSVLGRQGRLDEAVAQFQEALRLKPDHAGAQGNLRVAEALRRERSRPQGK